MDKNTKTHRYLPWSKKEDAIEFSDALTAPDPQRKEDKGDSMSVIQKPAKPLYEQILYLVRNMEVLTDPQMAYVRTLPKEKVLEIVDIYNRIMRNVYEAFS